MSIRTYRFLCFLLLISFFIVESSVNTYAQSADNDIDALASLPLEPIVLDPNAPVAPDTVLPIDMAVLAEATVNLNPPQISVTWQPDPNATDYQVYRRAAGEDEWGLANFVPAAENEFIDTNVVVGQVYEYQIMKTGTRGTNFYEGFGYVAAAINRPIIDYRGKLILLVDDTHAVALDSELNQLHQDLIGDGWSVVSHNVSPTAAVPDVKQIIVDDYELYGDVTAVFLFGHIPVPYSGLIAPDGHLDHAGAWPSDMYYGDIDGEWTDQSIQYIGSTNQRNHNVLGDGKFDQSRAPSDIDLQVGRVDMFDMPVFAPRTEEDLLRNYLNKDHAFRHGQWNIPRTGFFQDIFLAYGEGFGDMGWRNLSSLVGANNIVEGNLFTTLAQDPVLWSYANGPGYYDSMGGVGKTADFATQDPKAVFTINFGSYFGDWDTTDNFLRAPLATDTYGLTSLIGSRPQSFLHHMSLGGTIGASNQLSQNNDGDYKRDTYRSFVHVGLMGDPTLRMHTIAPPTNVSITSISLDTVQFSWDASTATNVAGYHIYKLDENNLPTRLTDVLVNDTIHELNIPIEIGDLFMVKAITLESSPTGTYYNNSQAAFAEFNIKPTHIALSLSAIAPAFYQSIISKLIWSITLTNSLIILFSVHKKKRKEQLN